MCKNEETITVNGLTGHIEVTPTIVENGDDPVMVYKGMRSMLEKIPEFFMYLTFTENIKRDSIKVKKEDQLNVFCYMLGKTRAEQDIINDVYHAIYDEDVAFETSFASLMTLKIVFNLKQGVAFLPLAEGDDVALVILEDVVNGVLIDVSIDEDSSVLTVEDTVDLFAYYKTLFATYLDTIKEEDLDCEGEFIEWVSYLSSLATQYGELLESDSEESESLRNKIRTMSKAKQDILLTMIKQSAILKQPVDPIELIESM